MKEMPQISKEDETLHNYSSWEMMKKSLSELQRVPVVF